MVSLLEVEGPTRRAWRIGEDFFFEGGWPKFMRDNNLEFEDFLNFSYARKCIFNVKIFGKNGYLKHDLTGMEELE